MNGVQPEIIEVVDTVESGSSVANTACGDSNNNNNKKPKKQQKVNPPSGGDILTAADMYESGFRIRNAGLCSTHTRLLVLITSAAAPAHSQNRQAIRMTWMNRYGPSVSMAFLVGTPQMPETDPVAQVLEAEEQALRTRLKNISEKNNSKVKYKTKSMPSESTGSVAGSPDSDKERNQFLPDQETNLMEGLDSQAMHGLNKAERAVQRVLGREHGRYGDLIECRSRDTYTNLTLKSISALEWTRQYCPGARYLLKTDDDMFIDVRRLLRFIGKVETEALSEFGIKDLSSQSREPINDPYELFTLGADIFESAAASDFNIELPPTIWGRLAHGWRPIRQHNSKYYVSRTQYSGRVFPDFCTGPAYLMTRSTVSPLYEAALGRDFDLVDDEDEIEINKNKNEDQNNSKDCGYNNQMLNSSSDQIIATVKKNTVPYLKLEDVYLTGVVAERLTRRAAERIARQQRKEKEKNSVIDGENNQNASSGKGSIDHDQDDSGKKTKSKTADIIVKIRRINDDQFANKKITGRALERAVCNGLSPSDTVGVPNGNVGFSWYRWYWGDTNVEKDSKKKKKDPGVISLHMVKFFEQFELWRRLMDGRTKCKS